MLDRKSLVECRRSEHRHVASYVRLDSSLSALLLGWSSSPTRNTHEYKTSNIYIYTCRGLVTYRTARHLEWLCFEEDTLRDGGGNNPAHDDKVEPF